MRRVNNSDYFSVPLLCTSVLDSMYTGMFTSLADYTLIIRTDTGHLKATHVIYANNTDDSFYMEYPGPLFSVRQNLKQSNEHY